MDPLSYFFSVIFRTFYIFLIHFCLIDEYFCLHKMHFSGLSPNLVTLQHQLFIQQYHLYNSVLQNLGTPRFDPFRTSTGKLLCLKPKLFFDIFSKMCFSINTKIKFFLENYRSSAAEIQKGPKCGVPKIIIPSCAIVGNLCFQKNMFQENWRRKFLTPNNMSKKC